MKYRFIFGPSRSGTTLLAAQIGQYTGSLVPPELQFLYPLLSHSNLHSAKRVCFAELLRNMEKEYSFHNLGLGQSETKEAKRIFDESEDQSVREFVTALLKVYCIANGLNDRIETAIEHSPVARRHVASIEQHFHGSKYVGIYRDPRAVFASFKKLPWGPNTAAYFALWWKNAILETLATKARYPDNVMITSYEDLLSFSESTLKSVSEFFGLMKLESNTALHTNFSKTSYNESQHALVDKPVSRSRVDAWMRELSDTEVAIIEHHCGSVMEVLGYHKMGVKNYSRISYFTNLFMEKPLYYLGARIQAKRRIDLVHNSTRNKSR